MNVWVFAQGTDATPSSGTLELLTTGRSLGTVTAADLGVTPVGWAGAGQTIVNVGQAEARAAGEIIEDDGEAYTKIVSFLENLKVI